MGLLFFLAPVEADLERCCCAIWGEADVDDVMVVFDKELVSLEMDVSASAPLSSLCADFT